MKNETEIWLESLRGIDHLEDLGVDGGINIKIDLMEMGLDVHGVNVLQALGCAKKTL
jgi:hypothetical protein